MSCAYNEKLHAYAMRVLPSSEASAVAAHASTCAECRRDLADLDARVNAFESWPLDVLRPSQALWGRLVQRVSTDPHAGTSSAGAPHREPEWEDVAPGISCQLLSTDTERGIVSMLVRLAPGVAYPAHTHAGTEELHLLDGELWIDGIKLQPGDYNRAEAGTSDTHVWSETGCTCVLITSTHDRWH